MGHLGDMWTPTGGKKREQKNDAKKVSKKVMRAMQHRGGGPLELTNPRDQGPMAIKDRAALHFVPKARWRMFVIF